MTRSLTRYGYIDIRDVEDLRNAVAEDGADEYDPDEVAFADALYDALGEHEYDAVLYEQATLIEESEFEGYARELAEDIGAIDRDARWPAYHIDWAAAAEDLLQDYSEVEVDGRTFYYRR